MSQEEAAVALDIRYSSYRRYEQGGTAPSVVDTARMADFFHVLLDCLARHTGQP